MVEFIHLKGKGSEPMIGYVFDPREHNIAKVALLWGQEKNLTVGNEVFRVHRVPQTRAGVGVFGTDNIHHWGIYKSWGDRRR